VQNKQMVNYGQVCVLALVASADAEHPMLAALVI
jgi:hypothetical protein